MPLQYAAHGFCGLVHRFFQILIRRDGVNVVLVLQTGIFHGDAPDYLKADCHLRADLHAADHDLSVAHTGVHIPAAKISAVMEYRQIQNASFCNFCIIHIAAVRAGRPAGNRLPRRSDAYDADHGIYRYFYTVEQAEAVPHRHLFYAAAQNISAQHAVPRKAAHGSLILQLNVQNLHLQHVSGSGSFHTDGSCGRVDMIPVQSVHHVLFSVNLVVETVSGVKGNRLVLRNADGRLFVFSHGVYDLVFDDHGAGPPFILSENFPVLSHIFLLKAV